MSRAPEVQVLDFQTQQCKILPSIALSYALMYAKDYMLRSYDTIYQEEISQGNFDSLPEVSGKTNINIFIVKIAFILLNLNLFV